MIGCIGVKNWSPGEKSLCNLHTLNVRVSLGVSMLVLLKFEKKMEFTTHFLQLPVQRVPLKLRFSYKLSLTVHWWIYSDVRHGLALQLSRPDLPIVVEI